MTVTRSFLERSSRRNRRRTPDERRAEPTPPSSPDRPRVLILSASIGTGHVRAAEAIGRAVRQLVPDARVRLVNVLDLATPPLRYCYANMYLNLIRHAPKLVGCIYDSIDRFRPFRAGPLYRLRVWLEQLNLARFVELLTAEPW